MVTITPSVMARNQHDLANLLKKYGEIAKTLHLDVVDGKFAPNRSLYFKFQLSDQFQYNAHLMVKQPEQWIKKYGHLVGLCIVQAGAINDKAKFIFRMNKLGKKVAFALKPEEKISLIQPYLKEIDYLLILTVNPGFYGSKYLKKPLSKIKLAKKINPRVKIIVDGGMNPLTVKDAVKAGAEIVVCGSYLAEAKDIKMAMKKIKKSLKGLD